MYVEYFVGQPNADITLWNHLRDEMSVYLDCKNLNLVRDYK